MKKRVVITGLGAVTPVGLNVRESWENLLAGKSGVGEITKFDSEAFAARIAAEVKGLDPEERIDKKELRKP